jgi:hypothetical protein
MSFSFVHSRKTSSASSSRMDHAFPSASSRVGCLKAWSSSGASHWFEQRAQSSREQQLGLNDAEGDCEFSILVCTARHVGDAAVCSGANNDRMLSSC